MNEISVLNLFLEAGLVVKSVMLILLLTSVLTWIVIIERYNFYKKIKKINSDFLSRSGQGKIYIHFIMKYQMTIILIMDL